MTPLRILFIIRSYRPDPGVGGGAKSVQTLAEGLQARGHDVHVLRLAPKGREASVLAEAQAAGIVGPGKPQLHVVPIRNVYWPWDNQPHGQAAKTLWHAIDRFNPWAARDVRRVLRALRPDVVNTSIIDGFSTAILREAKRTGSRLIHTMRDYYLICSRSGMYRSGRNCERLCGECKLVRDINRHQTKFVDLFLSNSDFVARTHRNFSAFAPEKPCAVQLNVNDRPLVAAPRELDQTRPLVFGYIGRLAPTKGVEKLIEAARALGDKGRDWSVVIAGDGASAYVDSLKALAADIPQVRFLGWRSADDFYSAVDLVICPSVYNEPLPRVIYEAYGFALPVIASRVGGNPEVIREGETGELYDGEDPAELAANMQRFRDMSNARYTTYSAGALALGAMFTPDAVIDAYEGYLGRVLDAA